MNYSKIIKYDSANGPGLRTTIFLTGCNIHCPSCFNKELQDFKSGNELTIDILHNWVSFIINNKSILNGISILGGEPFDQDIIEFSGLISVLNGCDLPIWIWSGHKIEELLNNNKIKDVFYSNKNLVGLVDSPFINDLRDLSLKFRGSSNQRVINVRAMRNNGFSKIILYDEYMDGQLGEGSG